MNATRRGFLASLLALPVVARLLPKAAPPVEWETTWHRLSPPALADYAAMYRDRLWLVGHSDPPGDIYVSSLTAFDEVTGVETPWPGATLWREDK